VVTTKLGEVHPDEKKIIKCDWDKRREGKEEPFGAGGNYTETAVALTLGRKGEHTSGASTGG